jgi:hypothetical protein
MTFGRQLNLGIAIAVTLVLFLLCTFYWALPVSTSLLIAFGVLCAALLFGRRFAAGVLELLR